jgi:hemerythrin
MELSESQVVAWADEYSVGNQQIDDQHKHIITLVNAVEIAVSSGAGAATMDVVFGHLARYLADHFAAEERLMARVSYFDAANHRQQHADCTRNSTEIITRIRTGETDPFECAPFVRHWLHTHLLGSDQAFARWRDHALDNSMLLQPPADVSSLA